MKSTDDALLDRLRKLKSLAEEAQNESECQTALLMFQKLLAKHGLTAADIEVEEDASDTICQTTTYDARRVESWIRFLNFVIARHFRCLSIYERSGKMTFIKILGHVEDVHIAVSAFKAAHSAALRLCDNFRLLCSDNDALKFDRSAYMVGFVEGIDAAYECQEASGELGLMVITPRDVVRAAEGIKKGVFTLQDHRNSSRDAGFNDGYSVGQGNAIA